MTNNIKLVSTYKEAIEEMVTEYLSIQLTSIVKLAGKECTSEQESAFNILIQDSGVTSIISSQIYEDIGYDPAFIQYEDKLVEIYNLNKIGSAVIRTATDVLKDERIIKGMSEISLQILEYLENKN